MVDISSLTSKMALSRNEQMDVAENEAEPPAQKISTKVYPTSSSTASSTLSSGSHLHLARPPLPPFLLLNELYFHAFY